MSHNDDVTRSRKCQNRILRPKFSRMEYNEPILYVKQQIKNFEWVIIMTSYSPKIANIGFSDQSLVKTSIKNLY